MGRNGIRGKAGDAGSPESGGWELLGGSISVLPVDCAVMESVSGWLGLQGGELLPYLESPAQPHPCPGDWEPRLDDCPTTALSFRERCFPQTELGAKQARNRTVAVPAGYLSKSPPALPPALALANLSSSQPPPTAPVPFQTPSVIFAFRLEPISSVYPKPAPGHTVLGVKLISLSVQLSERTSCPVSVRPAPWQLGNKPRLGGDSVGDGAHRRWPLLS